MDTVLGIVIGMAAYDLARYVWRRHHRAHVTVVRVERGPNVTAAQATSIKNAIEQSLRDDHRRQRCQ